MVQNCFHMVARGVALCLAVLRHHIQYQRLHGAAAPDRIRDAVHKEIWDDARIEAPWPEDDEVGPGNGLQTVRQRLRVLRHKAHLPDAAVVLFFRVVNFALAEAAGAVFKFGLKMHVLIRHWQHTARDGQHVAHPVDSLVKRAGDAVHRRKEQIAEALPREATLGEAVVQQLAHRLFRVGECQDAAPDIAGRQHPEILAQRAGAAAVVRNGDDRRDVARIALQSAQHRGQAMPAADGDEARRPVTRLIEADIFRVCSHRLTFWRCRGVPA